MGAHLSRRERVIAHLAARNVLTDVELLVVALIFGEEEWQVQIIQSLDGRGRGRVTGTTGAGS